MEIVHRLQQGAGIGKCGSTGTRTSGSIGIDTCMGTGAS